MKTFEVEGWYRYSNGDEKDFEVETFESETPEIAFELFRQNYWNVKFYSIKVKEI
jgi:hypothetical protein